MGQQRRIDQEQFGLGHGGASQQTPAEAGFMVNSHDEFRQLGVDVMVSALENREAADLGLAKEEEICRQRGIEFISFPIPDGGVPASPSATLELARSLKAKLEAGKNVAIHCRAGVGRCPTLAACVLLLAGMEPDAAFSRIQAVRGARVPDMPEQKVWVDQFALDHNRSEPGA